MRLRFNLENGRDTLFDDQGLEVSEREDVRLVVAGVLDELIGEGCLTAEFLGSRLSVVDESNCTLLSVDIVPNTNNL
jgi:hypothetical protein